MKWPPLADLTLPAKEHYSQALPYHNWQHALDVMENAQKLIEHAVAQGIAVTREIILVAAAWHDAGFHEDHVSLGFKTKEHYSAHLAAEFLKTKSIDPDVIKLVQEAILGTIHGVERNTIEALILHRADIANIGGPYEIFRQKNALLYREVGQNGQLPLWSEWVDKGRILVNELVKESTKELDRLQLPTSGGNSFSENAMRNATLLATEKAPT